MKPCGVVFALFLMLSAPSWASTYTATSCSQSAVNAVINGPTHTAVDGDTIVIPAGTCTWTSTISVPSNIGITITGYGTPNSGSSTTGAASSCTQTYILDNAGNSSFLFAFSPEYGNSTTRLSCMAIDPATTGSLALYAVAGIEGTCTSSGCPQLRVDNLTFGKTNPWTETNNGSNSDEIIHVNDAFGVLDHNTAPSGNGIALFIAELESYLGVGDNGDNSWAQPNSLGGANNIFAENNLWYTDFHSLNDCEAPLPWGCRVVIRYNSYNPSSAGSFGIAENHGTDTTGRGRSGREMEVYDNNIDCPLICSSVDGGLRGGTALVFDNTVTLTAGQGASQWFGISLYRTVLNNNSFGACGGDGPWDKNDNVIYYNGTLTSTSGGGGTAITAGDSTKSWTTNQLVPSGDPYTFYDVTQGFWLEIASNTSDTFTTAPEISEEEVTANVGDSYQIIRASLCIDQPGRGTGAYLSGNSTACSETFNSAPSSTSGSPCGYPNQALEPIYQWGDSKTGPANVNAPIQSGSGKIIDYRDYYTQASGIQTSSSTPFSCNGSTGGVGWGTLADRPSSCSGACSANTPGCGYFATDQGSQGTLYVWESGAWTTYYQPYTYPHPLEQGVAPLSPAPPTQNQPTVQPLQ